jgi:hypothetical protein
MKSKFLNMLKADQNSFTYDKKLGKKQVIEMYLSIIYGFMSRSRIFHLYGDVTITGEGLQS